MNDRAGSMSERDDRCRIMFPMPPVAFFAAATLLTLAVTVAFLMLAQRRSRRHIAELMARLEELESRWHDDAVVPAAEGAAGATVSPTASEIIGGPAGADTPPSGDVLAGLTSHVKRLTQSPGNEAATLADQAILCVYRHIEENLAPTRMADELLVSLRTLERGLAVALDCTPRQLILAVKMREARRLLTDDGRRVSEVAYHLGFSDPFHFSRRFKTFYGVAPSEVRSGAHGPRAALRSE